MTYLRSLYLGARQGFRCCSACPSKASSKSYWPELAEPLFPVGITCIHLPLMVVS